MNNPVIDPLRAAVDIVGLQKAAKLCGVTYPAVSKWLKSGLPRTEWSGESSYAQKLAEATGGRVTAEEMLAHHSARRARFRAEKHGSA